MHLTNIIQTRLAQLNPISMQLRDDSALHAGHAGNTGGSHFHLTIVSAQFSNKTQLMRHRLIYQALSDLMPQQIHAISILAISPDDPN